jgi:hypothetical protein
LKFKKKESWIDSYICKKKEGKYQSK